jgi:hypothetical protein
MIRKKSPFGCGITAVFIVVATASVAQLIDTAMNAYAQKTTLSEPTQQQQPTFSPAFLSTNQTSDGWMTSFDLENCDFASRGKQLFYSRAWIPSHLGG